MGCKEGRRRHVHRPWQGGLTPQTARKSPSRRVRPKCRARGVALLGFGRSTPTFVARLAIIGISARTRAIMDLTGGALLRGRARPPEQLAALGQFRRTSPGTAPRFGVRQIGGHLHPPGLGCRRQVAMTKKQGCGFCEPSSAVPMTQPFNIHLSANGSCRPKADVANLVKQTFTFELTKLRDSFAASVE